MRAVLYRCDACRAKVSEEDADRERMFKLSTPFRSRELDLCRDCWNKMCAAVGLDPRINVGPQEP